MKLFRPKLTGILFTLLSVHALATTHYVDLNSANPISPFLSWTTAATNIQDAIDVATNSETVLVTNGIYQVGGRRLSGVFGGLVTNRVLVAKAVTLQSVNGPAYTIIKGYQVPGTTNGSSAIRCVYLTNNAVLNGFTIAGGATRNDLPSGDISGGGVYCRSFTSIITNCVMVVNSAVQGGAVFQGTVYNSTIQGNLSAVGGGAYSSSLINCMVMGNSATNLGGGIYNGSLLNSAVGMNSAVTGGAMYQTTATNCTIIANSASGSGGAAYSSTIANSILYYNTAPAGQNYQSSTLNFCCTTPIPSTGIGNLTNAPKLASLSRLNAGSPCVGAGSSAYTNGLDIDGETWMNPPSTGCDEYHPVSVSEIPTAAISVDSTNLTTLQAANLVALIDGPVTSSSWDFGDGTTVSNQVVVSHSWVQAGDYNVRLTAFNANASNSASVNAMVHVISAPVYYVNINNQNPQSPYLSWGTAATNIQDAIDAAPAGSIVIVTNGVYATGAKVVVSSMTNRVAITKPILVRSVNGPSKTFILGNQVSGTFTGNSAIRCVYITNGATLSGFTLTNGATRQAADVRLGSGAGVWAQSSSSTVSNCIMASNMGYTFGGGAFGGTIYNSIFTGNNASRGGATGSNILYNCALFGNSGAYGGAAYGATLNNCTVTGNLADSGGGVYLCAVNNGLIYYNNNKAQTQPNYSGSAFNYSCTKPLPAGGVGNSDSEPQLSDFWHVTSGSPCLGSGNGPYAYLTDIDGDVWQSPPAIGCDEYQDVSAIGPLSVAIQPAHTNVAVGFSLNCVGQIDGHAGSNVWDFGDGTLISNLPYAAHSWSNEGDYNVKFTAYNYENPGGVTAMVNMHVVNQPKSYVDLNSTNQAWPYSSWTTAATNIQDAIDAAVPGGMVLVSNGTYQVGFRVLNGNNRIVIGKPVALVALNGPEVTIIDGKGDPVRCVYVLSGASMSGFTLTNGAGGIYGESTAASVSNCIVTGCLQSGVIGGTIYNSIIVGNNSNGGGGGADSATLNNCIISGNVGWVAGGASSCNLNNCVVVGNTSTTGFGGGVFDGTMRNCIIQYNNGNNWGPGQNGHTFQYCCTIPLPVGPGNITDDPMFVDGSYILQSNSPCINAGNNAYIAVDKDFDRNPRIVGGTVDIGAHEYQSPSSILSYTWAQQYGLPTDGSADFTDTDGDSLNNYSEWIAGSVPTNSVSVLKLFSPSNNVLGLKVSWQSVSGKTYFLQRATNLISSFTSVQSNLVGQVGTTVFSDTTATNSGPYFYRVGVQ